ncbi:hypothetical protein E2C01_063306 [Portunus trituberculatus]|uniref:Uncharacterized protein n=1 Tax=Portunus trituberculatus TaxID=210409 RepID=A0A5B7H8U0_PORTR|nr:hypothetical protein [Portunus trituberculatus]
MAEGNSHIAF